MSVPLTKSRSSQRFGRPAPQSRQWPQGAELAATIRKSRFWESLAGQPIAGIFILSDGGNNLGESRAK